MAGRRFLAPNESTTGTLPVSVRLPPYLKEELDALVEGEGRGASEIFRDLLIKYLAAKKKRRPGGRR